MTEEKEKSAIPVGIESIDPEQGLMLSLKKPFSFFFAEEDGVEGVTDVAIDLSLTKSGDEIFAAGMAAGTIRLQCSRCLAEFDHRVEAAVEAPFFPKSHDITSGGGDGEEPEDDEGDVNLYEGETLDVFPVLYDLLFLALPLKPLCREDCKGLCPKCGADLNVTTCGCPAEKRDFRLTELEKLKEKL